MLDLEAFSSVDANAPTCWLTIPSSYRNCASSPPGFCRVKSSRLTVVASTVPIIVSTVTISSCVTSVYSMARSMSNKTMERSTTTRMKGEQIPLRERRMNLKNRVVEVDPEELEVGYDLRPLLKNRVMTTGRNLIFTDRNTGRQFWIESDGADTMEYVVTDSVGVQIDSKFVTTTSKEKRKSCFICSGGGKDPKTYEKIECADILILTDEKMAQPDK